MTLQKEPVAKAQMIIRRPVSDVFNAFVDPNITSRIWFTKSSGKLEPGKKVTWEWEMYGVSTSVVVKELERDKRLLIEWGAPPTVVEWRFTPQPDNSTFVYIENRGFRGTDDERLAQAVDSTGGFAFLLAGLKALLEHDIELNLVADHVPRGR